MKNRLLICLATIVLGVGSAGIANAHTTSIGFVPGLNPGEVTFWTGSYHSSGVNEGTLTLTGVLPTVFGPDTRAFNIGPVGTKPAGLLDGTNNFFWAANTSFPVGTDPILFGGVEIWQGVTFSGLNPGTYDFTCGATCGTTAVWNSFGSGTGRLGLQGRDIGGGGTDNVIPEPATMSLLGSSLIGFFGYRRKKKWTT